MESLRNLKDYEINAIEKYRAGKSRKLPITLFTAYSKEYIHNTFGTPEWYYDYQDLSEVGILKIVVSYKLITSDGEIEIPQYSTLGFSNCEIIAVLLFIISILIIIITLVTH